MQFEGFPAGAIRKVLPPSLASDGIPVAELESSGFSKAELKALLSTSFVDIDLDWPGMRVHCFDPPVLTADGYLTEQECDDLVEGAKRTNGIVVSRLIMITCFTRG